MSSHPPSMASATVTQRPPYRQMEPLLDSCRGHYLGGTQHQTGRLRLEMLSPPPSQPGCLRGAPPPPPPPPGPSQELKAADSSCPCSEEASSLSSFPQAVGPRAPHPAPRARGRSERPAANSAHRVQPLRGAAVAPSSPHLTPAPSAPLKLGRRIADPPRNRALQG